MKRSAILFVLLLLIGTVSGTNWVEIQNSNPAPANFSLITSDINSSVIKLSLDGYYETSVKVNNEVVSKFFLENGTPILKAGAPELQKVTTSLIIPDQGSMSVKVVSSKYKEYKNISVLPSKGNLYRDINPEDMPFQYGEEYQKDEFYPGELTSLRDPHILRDFRGQTVVVYPFQYNPVQKVLRVYYEIELEVSKTADFGTNDLTRQQDITNISTAYKEIYSNHFLNYNTATNRYTPVDDHGNMLIISYGDFMDEMQPLIDWKTISGMEVEMVDVATIGGSAQIKQYIATYYNDNGLTFVLLVGDAAQIPASSVGGNDSDNDYVYIVGNDHYPDAFIGRFSATSEDHVVTQVARTIEYEKDPTTETGWWAEAIGIASNEGPGDDGEYDYQHIRNIGDDLLAFTYTYTYELFDGSQGGNDASGNPSPSDVAIAVNSGATIINYTGHGSNTAWSTSGFSNSDVNNLTNVGKWPFIFDVACVNGNFVGLTCFAEAWLRATDNGEPTGAVAAAMSTINQSWNPPMCGQDEMVDILTEQYPDNIKRTFAGCAINGCLQMNDEYGSDGDEMTDTWTIFGDPSVMVRTMDPQTMTVTTPPAILLGTTELTIECDAEGGLAVLSDEGVVIATAFVENGEATFTYSPMTQPGNVDLVVTAFNYRPHISEMEVIAASGPYLLYADHNHNDTLGNGNNVPECNENILLTVGIQNLGIETANLVEATISLVDPYMTVIDDFELYDSIPVNSTVYKDYGFEIKLAEDIPDLHEMNFTITSVDENDSTWVNNFVVTACAPVLTGLDLTIDDSEYGDANGRLDAGEQATLTFKTTNEGHSVAYNVIASLTAYNPYIQVISGDSIIPSLSTFGASYIDFEVLVADNAPEGILAEMKYKLVCGAYEMEKSYFPKVGLIVEDWETGDFSKFDWNDDGNMPWVINNQYPYEGFYDVTSGAIGNNQESELWIRYEVMSPDSISFYKKVSSEVDFDKLKFYIDNTLMAEWSGTSESWTRESFAVQPGLRKFRWVYDKDFSGVGGADKAWVDYIELPIMLVTTVYAGPDDENCEESSFVCQGAATNYTSLDWETLGTGTFENQQSLDAIYTPSAADIDAGETHLVLNIVDADGLSVSDTMLLVYTTAPKQPEKPVGPVVINLNEVTITQYTTIDLPEADGYIWYLAPDEAGSISSAGIIGEVTWNDDFEGDAWISVAGTNECGIGVVSDSLQVEVGHFVGIDDNESSSLSIVPNPNNGIFTINLSGDMEPGEVLIYNTYGSVVNRIMLEKKNTSIDLSSLPSGIYFIMLKGSESRIIEKLIIER